MNLARAIDFDPNTLSACGRTINRNDLMHAIGDQLEPPDSIESKRFLNRIQMANGDDVGASPTVHKMPG